MAALSLATGTVAAQGAGHTLTGFVYDSVTRSPLRGAAVQLVTLDSAARTYGAVADSLGAYSIGDLPAGRYMVGFDHLSLQALGLETPLREIVIGANVPITTVDLAIPAPRTVRALRCRPDAAGSADGMLAGFVRDADIETAVPGARVELSWREIVVGRGRLQVARRVAVADVGWSGTYVACGLPSDARIAVRVSARGHLGATVDVELPDGGAARQDFFIADSASLVAITDSASGRRSLGNATMSGRVRRRDGSLFAGARVGIVALNKEARARDDGTYTLAGLPPGTWTAETRAIGYEPVSQIVVLNGGRTTTASFSVDEQGYTLDAVTIKGERPQMVRLLDDIASRKRLHSGTFFLAGDRVLEGVWKVSDVFRLARGFTVRNAPDIDIMGVSTDSATGDAVVQTQAGAGNGIQVGNNRNAVGGSCKIHVYIDGTIFPPGFSQLDNTVAPGEVIAIEAYATFVDTPVQWRGMDECGTVMIWTKRMP